MCDAFLGNGIFTADSDTWKYHRTMARPFFATERVSDFACFERHLLQALKIMSEHADRNQPLDVQARTSWFSLECRWNLIPDLLKHLWENSTKSSRTHFYWVALRFSSFTLDVGVDFLFGYSARSLIDIRIPTSSRLPYELFSDAFNLMSRLVTKRIRMCVLVSSPICEPKS